MLIGCRSLLLLSLCVFLSQCASSSLQIGNLGGPTLAERTAQIVNEPDGNFYYGRRYFVEKTRFWGYVRQPRQSWSKAKLVMMREDQKHSPDRLPEGGPPGQRYGYDANREYRLYGSYTGKQAYDPNSDQLLPEFLLSRYELINTKPGWLFRPDDRYNPSRITMTPR